MKRAPGLVEISRRDFCAFASAIVIVGCTADGPGAIGTGGLNGPDGNGQPDASGVGPSDGSMPLTDAGSGAAATCPATGATDVGAPTTFVANTPVYVSSKKLFVIRDSGGLYAMTAVCTHEGATCDVQGADIFCPRHGALFTFNGAVVSGPPTRALVHYAMCTMTNGHVGVLTAMQVAATERLVA
jgi:cytochrome b6-f complex iron-sulfur subunit